MGHLSALMRKNWILWKKGKCCSILEIVFPVLFTFFFFIFRGEADQTDIAETSYSVIDIEKFEKVPFPMRLNSDSSPFSVPLSANSNYDLMTPLKLCKLPPGQKFDLERQGYIALAPQNVYTEKLSQMIQDDYQYETKFFQNKEEIFDEATSADYEENICLGISFSELGKNNKWSYNLHFNVSAWDEDEEIPDTQNQLMNKFDAEDIKNHLSKWVNSGFLGIQNWIDNMILKELTGNNDSEIIPWITSHRIDKYVKDELPELLKGNLGTYLILPQIIVFLRMAYALMEEKEKKIKESMKIMGLSDSAFYLSWCIHYGVIYFCIAFLVTIMLQLTIYPSSNFLLILIWFLFFCWNLMSQSLMVTTFFSKAKIGNVFGMVLFFSLYIVAIIIGGNQDLSKGTKVLLSIFPQVNMSQAADVFLMTESTKNGIGFSNIDLEIERFSILISLLMFLASFALHALIGIYCDLVIPGEFGAKKHPLFFILCLFKHRKTKEQIEEEKFQQEQADIQKRINEKENVEEVDALLKEKESQGDVLKIDGLGKVYSNGKKAVNDLNITMYKDQISCLLGHNGSGKTSTISMLTGMQSITKGDAKVFGYDVKTQMDELRKIMGVCPQHDVLYPNLSVREHLEMYAQFKGMTDKKKIEEEIEQLLHDVDLKFKEHAPTKSLSGGQKRRVSIAIAFIGGSKLVYLDEPTSGCDTSVRRSIWDMLRKYKNDRIVVLTTHFMDEADYLGDRITIIGEGHLICSGSPVFLKQKFGVGYNLTIVKKETISPSKPITDVVMQQIPDAKKVSDVSAELAFQLKISAVPKFQNLFNTLDAEKDKLQIANYGISITTMEEVFLKVAHSNQGNKSVLMSRQFSRKESQLMANASQVEEYHHLLTIVKNDNSVSSSSITELVISTIPEAKKKSDVATDIVFELKISAEPLFQELLQQLDNNKQALKIASYNMEKINHKNKEIDTTEVDNFDLNSIRETNVVKIFLIHFTALIIKRLRYFKRDKKGLFCEMILPCLLIIGALWALTIQTFGESPQLELDGKYIKDEYETKQKVLYGADSLVDSSIVQSLGDKFNKEYYDMKYSTETTIEGFDLANLEARKKDAEEDLRLGGYFFQGLSEVNTLKKYEYQAQVETLFRDSAPLYVNEMNEAIIKRASGNDDIEIICNVSPLPYTQKFLSFEGADKGIQSSFSFAMILSFIPASLIVFIVREREEQVKHQQIVSGISLMAYWSSNLVVDILKYYFPVAIFSILMFLAYDIETYTEEAAIFSAVILLFLLYGVAIVPFTYLSSFAFKKYGNAQVLTFFVHYIMGGVAPLIVWLLDLLVESARPYTDVLQHVLKIFPSFCFGLGMINLGSIEAFYQIKELDEKQQAYDFKIAGASIIFLIITAILYFALIFAVEFAMQRGAVDKLIAGGKGCPQYIEKVYDNDVQKEIDTVANSKLDDYVVRVDKLRKVFKVNGVYNQAVDRVSFGIKYGECFTLLGVNGAGKTTIFKILSGDIHATSGTAHIKGYDVTTDMASARYHIGYCPQFDALLENLTTREHLELYSAVKGIPSNKRKALIDKKIKEMELSNFENVCAGTYSGGNKRKLSVAVAMIGNPPIVFLDEPSTGMDPVARRYMWDVISRITTLRKQSSVILTTHSMEEAEALSTRMTIQVAGQLKCIGPIQHIKSKFGGGYEVEVKLKIPADQVIIDLVKSKGLQLDLLVDEVNFQQIIDQLGYSQFKILIAPGQIGEDLYNKLKGVRKLPVKTLVDFCITEQQTIAITNFINENFGQYQIIEHFGTYSRYKVQTNIPTGKIFGAFEQDKQKLEIASYSVKQATIESIFNEFAIGKIDTQKINQEQNQREQIQQGQQVELSKQPILENKQQQQAAEPLEKKPSNFDGIEARQVKIESNSQE